MLRQPPTASKYAHIFIHTRKNAFSCQLLEGEKRDMLFFVHLKVPTGKAGDEDKTSNPSAPSAVHAADDWGTTKIIEVDDQP